MKPSRLRRIGYRVLPTALLVGVFMLGFMGAPEDSPWLNSSRIWGPGDPFYSETDPKFIAHPTLIWRGRPNVQADVGFRYGGIHNRFAHNNYGLRDDDIAPQKPANTVRILNVGDSATWGLNLAERSHTYSDQLERLLNERAPGSGDAASHHEVINAGTVGYTSLQGLQFLRTFLPEFRPDIVTVYLGNNDSAPSGVRDADRISAAAGPLREWLGHNLFYLLLRKGYLAVSQSGRSESRERLVKAARGGGRQKRMSKADYYELMARVPPDQYEENLRAIVELVRGAGARLILLKVPVNWMWPPAVNGTLADALDPGRPWTASHIAHDYLDRVVRGDPALSPLGGRHPYLSLLSESAFLHELRRQGDPVANPHQYAQRLRAAAQGSTSEALAISNRLAVVELVRGEIEKAETLLKAVLAEMPACSCFPPRAAAWVYYNLGVVHFLQGRDDRAFELFRKSRSVWPLALSPDYGERFDRVVRELRVEWIDLPSLFAEADPTFRGSALIHDWVHPSRLGGAIIADAIGARVTAHAGERRAGDE